MSQFRNRSASTLIEMVIVIGVIGVIMSLLVSAVQNVRMSAARVQCTNNLKQQSLALHSYESVNHRLPPSRNLTERLLSWQATILPYIDHGALWNESVIACQETRLTYKNPPHIGYATVIPAFVCPLDSRLLGTLTTPSGDYAAFTDYLAVSGSSQPRGFLSGAFGQGGRLESISDGTSSTLMLGERPPPGSLQAGRWYSSRYVLEPSGGPDNFMGIPQAKATLSDYQCWDAGSWFGPGRIENPCDRYHYWSLHPQGATFSFADGSVRFIRYNAADLMPALATRAGGEIVSVPD